MNPKYLSSFLFSLLLVATCNVCFADGTTLQDMVIMDTSEKVADAIHKGDILLADQAPMIEEEEEIEEDE